MTQDSALTFDSPEIHASLDSLQDSDLDRLDFGVIGIDSGHMVRRYSAWESRMAGLAVERVIGKPFFTVVAACMNNFMVAQRFVDADASGVPLDATINYVLTFRMNPTKVRLRLVATPGHAVSYVLVDRTQAR